MQKRALQPLFLTLALCALPWIAAARPSGWLVTSPDFAGFLKPLPYLLLAALAFIGVKLNQTRLFFVSLFLTTSYLYLQGELPAIFLDADPWARTLAVGLAAPLSLGLVFLAPEGRLWDRRSVLSTAAALGPLILLAVGFQNRWPSLGGLVSWQGLGQRNLLRVPEITTLVASAFALAAFLHRNPARRILHVFLAVSLVPLWAALNYRAAGAADTNLEVITALAFACQSGLLVYAVFLLYWERVYLDELTSIPNRRALNEHLARLKTRYAIAMVDIDHFKRFNDSYGHEEGDNALRFVAAHLDQTTNGRTYRYGGEEFTVIFEESTAEQAAETMDQARRQLAEKNFTIRPTRGGMKNSKAKLNRGKTSKNATQIQLTFSIGIAACPTHAEGPEEVRIAADEALYDAKEAGRNCVALVNASSVKRQTKTK